MNTHNNNEKGAALIIVLVVLVSVTLICISVMNSSDFESKILGSFKNHEITFHLNDGSLAATSKLIYQVIDKKDNLPIPPQFLAGSDPDDASANLAAIKSFSNKIKGFGIDPPIPVDLTYKYGIEDEDTIDMGNGNIDVDVEIDMSRVNEKSVEGSSAEFMQNAGIAMQNRTEILYTLRAVGTGKSQSRSVISVIYSNVQ